MNNKRRRFLFQSGGHYHLYYRDTKISDYEQPHMHTFYQCVFVKKGRITQIQNGEKYQQVQGEVFLTPPGCEHSLYVFASDSVYYCLSFSKELAAEVLTLYPGIKDDFSNIRPIYTISEKSYRMLDEILAILIEEPESISPNTKTGGYHLACAAMIAALADALTERQIEGRESYDAEDAMDEAIQYIEQFYNQDLTIEEIAERFKFKKASFCRKFIQKTGISPKRYITEKRIHEALRLMGIGSIPLNKIAEEVGYNDFSTFYRNFCKMMEKPPSEYRSQAEKQAVIEFMQRF